MFKRIAIGSLASAAVIAAIISVPVHADTAQLTIKVSDNRSGTSISNIKVYTNTGGIFANFTSVEGNLIDMGWQGTTPSDRATDSYITTLINGAERTCDVNGRSDRVVPLQDEVGEAILEVSVSVASDLSCMVQLPTANEPGEPGTKTLNVHVLPTTISGEFSLNLLDYDQSHMQLNSNAITVPHGGDTVFNMKLHENTHYSSLSYNGMLCKFETDNSEKIMAPALGESEDVYADVAENACTLSLLPPSGEESIAIATCSDFEKIKHDESGKYHLTANIHDCVLETISGEFKGIFDGRNYTLYNLSLYGVGLFSKVVGGEVKDLKFYNAKVSDENDSTARGLIAGHAANQAKISNIFVDTLVVTGGQPKVQDAAGGIVGHAEETTIENVHLYSTKFDEGGISIENQSYAGGIVGEANLGTLIIDASISSLKNSVYGCTGGEWDCAIGGLVGRIATTSTGGGQQLYVNIRNSAARGKLEAQRVAGGLIGLILEDATVNINNSYAIVDTIQLKSHAAGIIGAAVEQNEKNVNLNYVYAAGHINLKSSEGGKGIISKESDKTSGRVAGSNIFFDTEATGQAQSGCEKDLCLAKTTTEMHTTSTFNNWDKNIWNIVSGTYPTLKSEPVQ